MKSFYPVLKPEYQQELKRVAEHHLAFSIIEFKRREALINSLSFPSMKIILNEGIDGWHIFKDMEGNLMIPEHLMYKFYFVNGVNDQAINDAVEYAKKKVREKISRQCR